MVKSGKDRSISGAPKASPRARVGWRVGMKTFGTKDYLEVTTRDVSATGILLKVEDPKVVAPFQKKTLLELVFYPDGKLLREEIRLTGVVVRAVNSDSGEHNKEQFGVRFVDPPEDIERAINQILTAS